MRVNKISTTLNDAKIALVTAELYMTDFVPVTTTEAHDSRQVLKVIKRLLKEVHNREKDSI